MELVVTGENGIFFIEAADQAFQLGDLLSLFPDVHAEECDQDNKADRESLEVKFSAAQPVPRHPGKDQADQEQNKKGEAPEFLLAFFEELQTFNGRGARLS